ncbi:MAG: bifunctional homocysteine S-methyltransferase/methylenetetrahydrofolate reductase [Candidatus Wallbacteria bacterium GWC2_49_35]|uniref:Bifunctional homocysteine S-methyltransferase/methylenetetrahydrofolate reductase n=1 Tax=Candidatus Wallbacteria bacterium GWC2_49_35 TaxID=1817813 RepID=A0A1F7WWD6_9BACT|nr:MAG: bifunctional homocysteine S-methyltransferase/methylenetetrahydrofolate reductase [Candidatus Wallbacteria bacterium GWC2_49_35]
MSFEKPDFMNILNEDRIMIFDGAMGTMLYSKGIYINRCFDEMNLSAPNVISDIHAEYVGAGAQVIETNTFGANRCKLAPHGFAEQLEAINYQGAKLAVQVAKAAQHTVYVAGSIGPLGIKIEPWGKTSVDEACEFFREQAEALLAGGVDLFVLETFSDINEMHQAIRAVKSLCNLPILAQIKIGNDGNATYGTTPEVFTQNLDSWGADVIGLNCGVGPKIMLDTIELMSEFTKKKLMVRPTAGLPTSVDGRTMYLSSPEYFAEYTKRFIQHGVRIIGGCCGTTPAHIKAMASAARMFTTGERKISVMVKDAPKKPLPQAEPIAKEKKSKFAASVCAKKFVVTVEISPPKGCDATRALESAKFAKENNIDAINIPDGPRATARMSPQALAGIFERGAGIETILHYCCRDRNLLGMQSDLLGAYASGLKNVLLITGDPPKLGDYPDATAVFDVDSIGLTNMVHRLNSGCDLGGNPIGKPTGFFIGVGANPGAIDLNLEIKRFEYKVEAGAEFAITQPVFDIALLENFLKRIEHVRVPIIAGIWPLASLKNAEFMNNEVPGMSIPEHLMKRMRTCDSAEKQREEGIKIAREALAALKDMVQGVQISAPFGRVATVLEVIDGIVAH